MPKHHDKAILTTVLRPTLPKLIIGAFTAVASGLAMVFALWLIVLFVTDTSAKWVIFACVLWFISAAMGSFSSWISHQSEADFSSQLRRKVASHLVQLPASTLARQDSDKLKRLVSEDIKSLHHMIAHLPSEFSTFIVVPFVSVLLLISTAGPISLVALLPGALASLYYLIWVPYISTRYGSERAQIMRNITAAVNDYTRGIRVSRIYGVQTGALATYHRAANQFTFGMMAWVSKVATPAAVAVALLQAVATFAIAYAVIPHDEPTSLAAALFFSLAVVTPALRLGHGLDYIASGRAAAIRLDALLKEPTLLIGNAHLPNKAPVLELKRVTLNVDNRPILQALCHQFKPATLTAIMGPSGIGKTSLLRAIAGLESLSQGAIYLAGVDMASLDAQARQNACLLIPQGDDVLSTTIRDNLALSAPEASDRQMVSALTQAQLDIPLDTNATDLSGGERQRVNLARAFLTPKPVILLDEPTSALDDKTAIRLMIALRKLAHDQHITLLMVTHDLTLASYAHAQLELKSPLQTKAQ